MADENILKSASMYFYVNGSKDYPIGQIISDPFGFVENGDDAETAIFSYTIKDLYNKLSSPKVVTNSYSIKRLDGSNYDGVFQNSGDEPISNLIFDKGNNEDYANINPNYNMSNGTSEVADNFNKTIYSSILNGTSYNGINYRSRAFWQKVFTITEFLREKELLISNNVLLSRDSDMFKADTGIVLTNDELSSITTKDTYLDQILTLFIGNTIFGEGGDKQSLRNYRRQIEFCGLGNALDPDLTAVNVTDLSEAVLNGTKVTYNNTVQPLWDILNIQYVENSSSYEYSSLHAGRLNWVKFKLAYQASSGVTEIWEIKTYFIPDAFVKNSASADEYEVYTYNDEDMDDEVRYPETSAVKGFNKYDNDYANTLSTGDKRGQFIIKGNSSSQLSNGGEFDELVMKKIVKIMRSGDYVDYEIYETLRITPFIYKNAAGINEVSWVPVGDMTTGANQTYQKFYVFYKNNPPTATTMEDQIQKYLLALHANCGKEISNADGVTFIGHGTSDVNDIRIFLSKMYPNMFTVSTMDIIPVPSTALFGSNDDVYNPEKYYQPASISDVYDIVRTITKYKDFEFSKTGVADIGNKAFPFEIFHVGGDFGNSGIIGTDNSGTKLKYNFPIICITSTSGITKKPLTSIPGFENYHQTIFNDNTSPVDTTQDLFQYVLLNLFIKMFTQTSDKKRYEYIGPVPIVYEADRTYDSYLAVGAYNVASFTLIGIQFKVYSQTGKNFGFENTEILEIE